jgi:hypothetical protein
MIGRRCEEVVDMAEPTTDHSILKRIEGLVHEEQHLYGKGELADHDQVRLEAIKHPKGRGEPRVDSVLIARSYFKASDRRE